MAYPGNFGRIVASGTLYGLEGFSFGLSIVPDFPGTTPLDAPGHAADVAAIVSSFFTSVPLDNSAVLTMVKFNEIGPNGRYVSESDTVLVEFDPGVAGIGTGNPAPQVALAVTLGTNKRRGRAHSGRFYLPVPTLGVQNDGLIDPTQATQVATEAAEMIDALNDLWAGDYRVGVASDVGSGEFEPVTSVRVGRVLDTIRSRRRSLPEAYVETPVAGP